MLKEKSAEELNKLYLEADSLDKPTMAEMRSNILLVAGDHYTKRARSYPIRVRDNRDHDSQNMKLRITKNHIYRASRYYKTNLSSYVPGVTIRPQKQTDIQDQKTAELSLAVWQKAKLDYRLREFFRNLTSDYVDIGEMLAMIRWDPNKGIFQGYNQKTDQDGMPMTDDEDGKPLPDEGSPVFSGDFVFERIYCYNLKRHPGSKTMDDTPCIIVDKMAEKDTLKRMYAGDQTKLNAIDSASNEEYIIFDSNSSNYTKSKKDQAVVKEFYYRPSMEYPMGYYYFVCGPAILDSGELPFGIWPFVWAGFDVYPGSPRGRSMIKIGRPYQAEINRASSQIALHQVTIGDDKIIHQNGTKLAPGGLLPGVRGITYQGAPPQILPGRDGGQFSSYIKDNIGEMESALLLQEISTDAATQLDPYTLLYRSMSQRKQFSPYAEKLEQAFIDICNLYLELSRRYLPDDALIRAVGRSEYINIQEFKNSKPLKDMIVVEPQEENIETKLGRQLTFNNILQYVGQQLDPSSVGRILKNLPFANWEDDFNDLTLDADSVKNEFLAIERGENPTIDPNDNHDYALKRYGNRMKQADFTVLHPQIQQMYSQKKAEHQQFQTKKIQDLQAAENGYIPIGGALIAADMYVPNEADPAKLPKRVRLPYQAVQWLIDKLQQQGANQNQLEAMNDQSLSDLAQKISQNHQAMGGQGQMPLSGNNFGSQAQTGVIQ